jgi:hypothetical protein
LKRGLASLADPGLCGSSIGTLAYASVRERDWSGLPSCPSLGVERNLRPICTRPVRDLQLLGSCASGTNCRAGRSSWQPARADVRVHATT